MPTKIEWAAETWNPTTGCSPVSEGCQNCYARRMANRLRGRFGYPADDPFRPTFHHDRLNVPYTWKKSRLVFVCSMGDLFHNSIPLQVINTVFIRMVNADWHTYILLTKRPERMKEFMMIGEWRSSMPYVWLGVTAENQKRADERIPILLQIPAAVRFVSVEPMLGPINLREMAHHNDWHIDALDTSDPDFKLKWVICGAETGLGSRPMELSWARDLRNQCREAGIPFFFKKASGQTPDDLMVREYPK